MNPEAGGSTSKGRDERPMTRNERRVSLGLSILAVALSLVALGAALLAPALLGPRTLMAQARRGGPVTIGATCTHYPSAEVSISVPGPGTIVVSATVGVGINHTVGVSDEARIFVASSPTDCTLDNYTAFVSVPQSLPTDPFHYETVPILRPFAVRASGAYAFYVNGIIPSGWDPGDRFDSASLVATFYPG